MDYWDWVAKIKREYLNKYVWYEGQVYKVVDVGNNGELYINRATDFAETTEVSPDMVRINRA